MSGGLFAAAVRVAARAAAIQIEELAFRSAVAGPSGMAKGKGREILPLRRPDPVTNVEASLDAPSVIPNQPTIPNDASFTNFQTVNRPLQQSIPGYQQTDAVLGHAAQPKGSDGFAPVKEEAPAHDLNPSKAFTPPPSRSKFQEQPLPIQHQRIIRESDTPTDSRTSPSPTSYDPIDISRSTLTGLSGENSTPYTPMESVGRPAQAQLENSDLPIPVNAVEHPNPRTQSNIQDKTTSTTSEPELVKSLAHSDPDAVLKPQSDTSVIRDERITSSQLSQPEEEDDVPVVLRASKVPSSRIGRLFHYGSLAASLSFGAASESIRRSTGSGGQGSVFMSDANVRRLVATLGRMRGAALKLGQFMSIQDNNFLPPEIEKVLHQVQANANYMPDWQMEKVMSAELGSDWQSLFSSFDRTPIASASIGQVHRGKLASSGEDVAVKIQFPGVASSISSDLANLSLLLRSSALLPKGLYLQNTIAVMRRELEDECDYVREAESGRKFYEYLEGDQVFVVPRVVDEASTGKVLTTQWMDGRPLSKMKGMTQETRNQIGNSILRLCLQELFEFRFMQTDPNWANFLYSQTTSQIQLIDFGASREYTKEFMDRWYRLLLSALSSDKEGMTRESLALGYLTGEEEQVMLEAHLQSMSLVASPFMHQGGYDFSHQTITDEVRKLIPVMLKYRLTPPPNETYSLNRKLSGAFLMCAKLGAVVDCQKLWEEVVGDYKTDEMLVTEQGSL